MSDHNDTNPEAYVELMPEDEAKKRRRPDHPYNPGVVPTMGRLLMTHPRIAPAIDVLQTELMFGDGLLNRSERELLAVAASAAQDCHY